MPHLDELLGTATFASVGLFAALALQPIGADTARAARIDAPVATANASPSLVREACPPAAATLVPIARAERDNPRVRGCAAKDAAHPPA